MTPTITLPDGTYEMVAGRWLPESTAGGALLNAVTPTMPYYPTEHHLAAALAARLGGQAGEVPEMPPADPAVDY